MTFQNKFTEANPKKIYLHLSKSIRVYGPHYPPEEKRRLEKFCKWMKERDYTNISLVINLPDSYFPFQLNSDSDIRNWERSEYCLNNSDLNILIFTIKGKNSGVTSEIDCVIKNNLNFLMFVETRRRKNRKNIRAGSSLIRGKLKKLSRGYHEFPSGDDDNLCNTIYQFVNDFFQ